MGIKKLVRKTAIKLTLAFAIAVGVIGTVATIAGIGLGAAIVADPSGPVDIKVTNSVDWGMDHTLTPIFKLVFPGRSLTDNEITMLQPIFGDTVDYDSVQIHHSWIGDKAFNNNTKASVDPTLTDDLIFIHTNFYSDDYAKGDGYILAHEMTHVWQVQKGMITLGKQYIVDYDYYYELEQGKIFLDYNIEEQAYMVTNYFGASQGFHEAVLNERNTSYACKRLSELAPVLALVFPIPEVPEICTAPTFS